MLISRPEISDILYCFMELVSTQHQTETDIVALKCTSKVVLIFINDKHKLHVTF